jgi:aspartyl-tRNA(Asn)/glutamyl-tRNA(Gln) amidotransferase subunit A
MNGTLRATNKQTRDNPMHYETINNLSRGIRDQQVSPVEVVEACLRRIAKFNPALNAFITVNEHVREQAKAAQKEVAAGHWRGPLHGVPVAVKDFYDTAGMQTTGGAEQLKGRIPGADADVVRRLKQAGAVIIGKTNMDAFGMATTGLTSSFGPVRNPWNDKYVSGGSSAGSACAVAAGLCYATVDTDAVGSVRLPAACCGVVGFKGSYGLISLKGILGDEPVDDFIRWMGHAGITTRSAFDAMLVLKALTGSPGEGSGAALGALNRSVRIGIGNNFAPSPEVRQAFNLAAAQLAGAGYQMIEVDVPFGDPGQGDMKNIERDRAGVAAASFLQSDVILLSTLETTIPSVKEASLNPEQGVSAELTAFANYYGLPAVSVPCGLDKHGMPIGLQIVGRPGEDLTVLTLAHQFEQISTKAEKHPLA